MSYLRETVAEIPNKIVLLGAGDIGDQREYGPDGNGDNNYLDMAIQEFTGFDPLLEGVDENFVKIWLHYPR